MVIEWTAFWDLASSTGAIFLEIIVLWCCVAGLIYWAHVSGTASLNEDVKYKVVEDDKPVPHS